MLDFRLLLLHKLTKATDDLIGAPICRKDIRNGFSSLGDVRRVRAQQQLSSFGALQDGADRLLECVRYGRRHGLHGSSLIQARDIGKPIAR
jgi:hypothetical protein